MLKTHHKPHYLLTLNKLPNPTPTNPAPAKPTHANPSHKTRTREM